MHRSMSSLYLISAAPRSCRSIFAVLSASRRVSSTGLPAALSRNAARWPGHWTAVRNLRLVTATLGKVAHDHEWSDKCASTGTSSGTGVGCVHRSSALPWCLQISCDSVEMREAHGVSTPWASLCLAPIEEDPTSAGPEPCATLLGHEARDVTALSHSQPLSAGSGTPPESDESCEVLSETDGSWIIREKNSGPPLYELEWSGVASYVLECHSAAVLSLGGCRPGCAV